MRNMNSFRSQRVYEDDYPKRHPETPYKELGMPEFNPNKYVEKLDIAKNGIPSRYVMTYQEQLYASPFSVPEVFSHDYAYRGLDYNDEAELRRGFQYYSYASNASQCVFSALPNLRDVSIFSSIPGLLSGRLYRSAYPLSEDPSKLVHVFQNILQIRTIIDMRGFPSLVGTDPSESLSRLVIYSMYRPYVYDINKGTWDCLCEDFDLIQRERIIKSRLSTQIPEGLVQLDVASAKRSIYSLNLVPPQSDSVTNALLDVFPTVKKFLARQSNSLLRPLKQKITSRFWHSGPESFVIPLISSGSVYFKAILDLLVWVEPPVLICSTHGKDRVGFLFMLILHIFGAGDEAIITDYCASEAGLKPLESAMQKQLRALGENADILRALPENGRSILSHVRTCYGSIDGYLDNIGFGESSRDALRKRFILESSSARLLYETPPNGAFWKGNPAVLIPKKEATKSEVKKTSSKRTPSMERVLRAVQLLELRDAFESEQKVPHGAWSIVRRRMKKLAKERKEALENEPELSDKADDPELISRRLSVTTGSHRASMDDAGEAGLDDKTHILLTAMKTREAVEEILLAKKIVLVKLQNALKKLTGTDVVKMLMHRNVQLYADKNRMIKVSGAPELSEAIVTQPEIFAGKPMRRRSDVLKHLYLFLMEESLRLKGADQRPQLIRRTSRNATRQTSSTDSDVRCANRFRLIEPEFFFHQLCDGSYKPKSDETNVEGRKRVRKLPSTFAQWLMDCWLVEEGQSDFGDPFAVRTDEFFVMPEILAKFMRIEMSKNEQPAAAHGVVIQPSGGLQSMMPSSDEIVFPRTPTSPISLGQIPSGAKIETSLATYLENMTITSNHLFLGLKCYVESSAEHAHTMKRYRSTLSRSFTKQESAALKGPSSPRYRSITTPLPPIYHAIFSPFISDTAGIGNVCDPPGKGPMDRIRRRCWNPLLRVNTMLGMSEDKPEPTDTRICDDPFYEEPIPGIDAMTDLDLPTTLDFFNRKAQLKAKMMKRRRKKLIREFEERKKGLLHQLDNLVSESGASVLDTIEAKNIQIQLQGLNAQLTNAIDDKTIVDTPSIEMDTKLPVSTFLQQRSRFTSQFHSPATFTPGLKSRELTPESLLLRMAAPIELDAFDSNSEGSCFDSDDERNYLMRKMFHSIDFKGPVDGALECLKQESIERGEKLTTAGRSYLVPDDVPPRFDSSLYFHPSLVWGSQRPSSVTSSKLPHHGFREKSHLIQPPSGFLPEAAYVNEHITER